ncbi:hypothetical protein B0H17DRAFT_1181478 [Mycena rosella]|uniref:Uncharacterized protein n=1 Tax=Mycena rosella TaxID=1033263 RepID=A0AAD7DA72_MYCRO|nr:hypothetical protein B0H17DRAFT_1181478 [Mycena rosella]
MANLHSQFLPRLAQGPRPRSGHWSATRHTTCTEDPAPTPAFSTTILPSFFPRSDHLSTTSPKASGRSQREALERPSLVLSSAPKRLDSYHFKKLLASRPANYSNKSFWFDLFLPAGSGIFVASVTVQRLEKEAVTAVSGKQVPIGNPTIRITIRITTFSTNTVAFFELFDEDDRHQAVQYFQHHIYPLNPTALARSSQALRTLCEHLVYLSSP